MADVKRTIGRLLDTFNILKPNIEEPDNIHNTTIPSRLVFSQYSSSELNKLVPTNDSGEASLDTNKVLGNVMEHLQEMATHRTDIKQRLEDLTYLTPEIKQVKQIYISSILSPNDMQTGVINISTDTGNSELDGKISEYLNAFFNNDFQLGVKLYRWVERAKFDYGSCPIIIIPRSNIRGLNKLSEAQISSESLVIDVDKNFKSDFKNNIITDIRNEVSLESLELSMDSAQDKIITELAEGSLEFVKNKLDNLNFVSNPFYLKDVPESKQKANDKLKEFEQRIFGQGENKVLLLSDSLDELEDADHPFIIEPDPNLTVPVCVPGSTSDHIGYFVLTDNDGNLMTSETYEHIYNCSKGLMENNFRSMYGSKMNNNRHLQNFNLDEKNKAAMTIFALTIKNLLKEQLNDLNVGHGITLHQYNSVSRCLFYNMIRKIKTNIVFVPAPLMIYYAFDYRKDGSGKSLLEDIEFVLSLRTTLMVANVLGSMKNAIDHKVIEIDVDEKNVNLEQTLTTYKNIAVDKSIPRFNNNPFTVTKDIVDQSYSIIPKNIKGLSGSLNIDRSHTSSNVTVPEPELIERFTNMFITHVGIPPEALNQINQIDYAISVATRNIHFSNIIRTDHRKLRPFNEKIVKNYIRYSKAMITKLESIVADFKGEAAEKQLDIDVGKIISSISVTLPTCNVSTDKVKYEEINNTTSLIDSILDNVYPNELVPKDDRELRDALTSIKLHMKSTMIKEFINNVGYHKTFNLPSLEDIDPNTFIKLTDYLNNMMQGINDNLKVLKRSSEDSGGGGSFY